MVKGDVYEIGWTTPAGRQHPEFYCQELQSFGEWYRQNSKQDWILFPVGERFCVLTCPGWSDAASRDGSLKRQATVQGVFNCPGSARNYVARVLMYRVPQF